MRVRVNPCDLRAVGPRSFAVASDGRKLAMAKPSGATVRCEPARGINRPQPGSSVRLLTLCTTAKQSFDLSRFSVLLGNSCNQVTKHEDRYRRGV